MSDNIVKFAEVSDDNTNEIRVKHYLGPPPSFSSKQEDVQIEMPLAQIVVVVQVPNGFLLNRFLRSGEYVGDTWHASLDDAFEQARLELGVQLTAWIDIPDGIDDWFEHIFPDSDLQ
jgi:hypothetical protein